MSDEQTEEELQAIEDEEEREFEEEFESEIDDDSPNILANIDQSDETPDGGTEEGDELDQDAAATPAATDDLDIAPDRFTELENRLQTRMRNVEGHIGGLKSQITAALDARQETTDAGGDAPTKKEIKAATGSTEKLEALRGEFPEWAEAIDEQVSGLRGQIGETVNQQEIQDNISGMVRTALTNSTVQLRELVRVDMAHPGWEETINSDGFNSWKDSQSEDFQALADSSHASDAIQMLDAYADSQATGETQRKKQISRKRRLESAVAPTSGKAAPAQKGATEEEDFLSAFNE